MSQKDAALYIYWNYFFNIITNNYDSKIIYFLKRCSNYEKIPCSSEKIWEIQKTFLKEQKFNHQPLQLTSICFFPRKYFKVRCFIPTSPPNDASWPLLGECMFLGLIIKTNMCVSKDNELWLLISKEHMKQSESYI